MGKWGPTNQRVLKARHAPLFSPYLQAPSFSGYNTVNTAGIPGRDPRPGRTFMHCVGHNEGCLVGHGPPSRGVHMAKDTSLGRGRGCWDFLGKQLNRQPLPLEKADRECQPGWGPGPVAASKKSPERLVSPAEPGAGPMWGPCGTRAGLDETGALKRPRFHTHSLFWPLFPHL